MRFDFLSQAASAKIKKVTLGSTIFLVFIGLIFTVAGGFAFLQLRVDPQWVRVSGEVVDVVEGASSKGRTHYKPVVQYMVGEKVYLVSNSVSTSSYPTIGSKREVAYNPVLPSQSKVVQTTMSWVVFLLFPLMGMIVIVVSVVSYIKALRRSRAIARLIAAGHKVQGVLSDIRVIEVQKNRSYKVVVSAADYSGVVKHYESDELSSVGALLMADFRANPIAVDVYIDLQDPSLYYVDIADLTDISPERIQQLVSQAQAKRM